MGLQRLDRRLHDRAGIGMSGSQAPGGLGLGLSLIARLSDDVQFSVLVDGGTQVRMTFCARPTEQSRA